MEEARAQKGKNSSVHGAEGNRCSLRVEAWRLVGTESAGHGLMISSSVSHHLEDQLNLLVKK